MRTVWHKIFWKMVTKQVSFMKIELQFRSDCVGQNTENAIKSWHLSWCAMPREGSAAVKYCGHRKVKGPENTQALFTGSYLWIPRTSSKILCL